MTTEASESKKRSLFIEDVTGAEGALEQLGETSKAAKELERARQAAILAIAPAKLKQANVELSLKSLIESKRNHRRAFGDLDGLGASMLRQGQSTALQVVEVNPDVFEIISGARRFRAAKRVDLKTLRCDVYEATAEQVTEMRVVENAQREDLKPIEEAENVEELAGLGYSPATIAKKLGKSIAWVHGRAKLLKLGAPARELLYDGKLPGSVALVVARFPVEQQLKALTAIEKTNRILSREDNGNPANWKDPIEDFHCSARQAIAFLEQEFMRSLKGVTFDLDDATLNPEKGTCTKCPDNTENQPRAEGEEPQKHGFCCDAGCFKVKTEAAWKLTTAKAEEKGAEVLTVAEAKGALNGIDYRSTSRYVKSSSKAFGDPKGRTYAQLVGDLPKEARPAIVIAPDESKNPVKLFERADVERALADAGHRWADKKAARKAAAGPTPETMKKNADKTERITRVSIEVLRQSVAAIRKKAPDVGTLRACALRSIEVADVSSLSEAIEPHVEGDGMASLFGFKTRKELIAWVDKKAKVPDLVAVLFAFELGDDFASGFGGYSATVKEVAAARKLDLKKLEQLDEQAHAEKPKEPAKEAA